MSGFQNGALHLRKESSSGNSDVGWIKMFASNDGNFYKVDENGQATVVGDILTTTVASISAYLNSRINNVSGGTVVNSGASTWNSLNQAQTQTGQTIYVSSSTNRIYVGVTVTGGPVTIVLPPSPTALTEVLVKHENGNISSNIITISGNGYNIDNFPTHVLDVDDAAYHYIFSNSQWRIF